MKREILGLIIGISSLSANAASIDYMSELYAGTAYGDVGTVLELQQNDSVSSMNALYDGTIYSGSYTCQTHLSKADIAAENETNGYFQEWNDNTSTYNEENGYWM